MELLGEGSLLEVCGAKVTVAAMSAEKETPLREKAQEFLNSRRGKKQGDGGGRGGHFRRGGKRRGETWYH